MFKLTLRLFMAILMLQAVATSPLLAQKKTFNDVLNISLRNKGAIMNGNDVSGYYFFYAVDKAERGKMNYLLKILDTDLNQVASKPITDDRSIILRECTYNGKSLMLKFQQTTGRDKIYTFRQYDLTGEKRGTKTLSAGKLDYQMEGLAKLEDGAVAPTLFAVPGKGFVNYTIETRKGALSQSSYIIDFLPEDPATGKEWKTGSDKNSEEYEWASYMACDEQVLLSSITKRKGAMSKDFEYYVLATDVNTGEKLFETSVEDSKYAVTLLNGRPEGDKIQLYGLYYEKDAKTVKAKSLGLCSIVLDNKGKAIDRQYISWGKDVSKFLPANEKGKIEDVGYMFFHNFIKAPDGTLFGIAENYRKAASAGGIAVAALGGGTSVAKMIIEDFYLFQFTPDFKLKNISVVEKNRDDIQLYPGMEYYSPQAVAFIMNYMGGFDYAFTQYTKDNSLFSIGYLDFENRKGERDGYVFGTLNYIDNEWVNDKIKLSSASTDFDVLPGKPGYVMVCEYFRKEKKIDVRLEKLNL